MEAQILLCDAAQVADGKLYILGGGWSQGNVVGPFQFSVALRVITAWNETNTRHQFTLRILTPDGQVLLGPRGNPMFEMQGEFEVGRPPGTPHGANQVNCLAVPLPPFLFETGTYEFRFEVGGETVGREPFRIVRQEGMQP